MAAGEARRLHKSNGLPVLIVGRRGQPTWYDVWDGIPYLIKRPAGRPFTRMMNCGGMRPYIAAKSSIKWTWKPYKPHPAEIVFTKQELAFAEPYRGMVMIEPNVKEIGHTNKAWLHDRWKQVALAAILTVREGVVQCGAPGTNGTLPDATLVVTPSFRLACAVLSVAKAFVGTDSGLMHAAAATGTPAVILWGEYTSPEIVGYSFMKNLRHAGKPCGNRLNCAGCRKAMEAITVAEVVAALKELL